MERARPDGASVSYDMLAPVERFGTHAMGGRLGSRLSLSLGVPLR